ncbi:adhesion G-protein coupled receptor G7 [Chaetodon trifascialis]|uniref:adhesion G-protein coupled receptor G7 n=1 Tax=Chaetodon trifascialis TaxID=109706 RepID=UPI003992137F
MNTSTPPPPTTPSPPPTTPPITTPPPTTPPTTPSPPPTTLPPTTPSPPPTTPPPTTPSPPPTTPSPPPTTPPPTTPSPPPTTPSPTPPPPPPPPPPSTPPPPLVCDNGGVVLAGVCVCPDDWTGLTCSEAGKPRASTRCLTESGSRQFEPPRQFQCDQTLSDIQQNLTSLADLESLATSTQILTSNPEELTAENIIAAAQIVNTLLLSPNTTESVRVAAVATVSQLLNASTPDDSTENNTTLGLTVTLDQLSVNLSLTLDTSQSQVVQPNLVVQSAQIPAADTQGVQFTSLSGLSGSFIADRIQLNTNTSAIDLENGFIADALIHVRFPPEAARGRQKPSNVSVGFVLYQNDRFFRSRRYRKQQATVRVLSASVRGQESSVEPRHVEMLFRPTMVGDTTLYDFACVFWNYSLGDWSTDGCSKGNASDGFMTCFCNHTTNFAALWSFREKYEYAEALDWISITGLSVSILGLVLTIIYHVNEKLHRSSKMPLLCTCVSLLAFIITFLSGVQNASRQNDAPVEVSAETNSIPDSDECVEPDRGSCSAVTALLHFFLLATFTWNSVYGTQLVLLVRTMRSHLPSHWRTVSLAVGWGVPAIIMAVTLGATYRVDNPLGYRQEEFCWLAALDKDKQFDFGKPMFWGFLLPVGLILIYNGVLLVLVSQMTCRTDPNMKSSSPLSLGKKFLISFSLAVLLGLSWTLGYLVLVTTGQSHLAFSIIFCICTTTQGLQIFILFTARKKRFRDAVTGFCSSVSFCVSSVTYSLLTHTGMTTNHERYRSQEDQQQSNTVGLETISSSE